MHKRSCKKGIFILAVIILVTAVLAYLGWNYYKDIRSSENKSETVIETMKQMVPGLVRIDDSSETSGAGRDPLVAMPIDGTDFVGCLEIPVLDLMVPVTSGESEEAYFVSFVEGSALNGGLRLRGKFGGAFMDLSKLEPGALVYFTDMDGVTYIYRVTTQYHLKSWDEGDNDLMLCYESDDKTDFVVGCTKQ